MYANASQTTDSRSSPAKPTKDIKLLQGLFKDIANEHEFRPLRIEGILPNDINGVYHQNGPGLFSSNGLKYGHLFDGDGLIRAVKFQADKAFGAVKLVSSTGLIAERAAGKPLYDGFGTSLPGGEAIKRRFLGFGKGRTPIKNTANTNVIQWQGKLLALNEGALPTELDIHTLKTIGETSLAGAVKGPFSAHPHWVSRRRCGYNFGVRIAALNTFLDIYQLPANGACQRITSVKLDRRCPGFVHDFIATENHLIFFIPPMNLTLSNVFQVMMGKSSFFDATQWQHDMETEVIIVPIDNPNAVIRFPVDPFFQVHFCNAYEDKGKLIVNYLRSKDHRIYQWIGMFHQEHSRDYHLQNFGDIVDSYRKNSNEYSCFTRAEIDLNARTMVSRPLDSGVYEFPRIHPGFQGSNNRFSYLLEIDEDADDGLPWFTNVIKYDHADDKKTVFNFGDNQLLLEPVFIPRENAQSEDDGYLLMVVFDASKQTSYLAIKDALHFSAEPLAKLHFEQPLPVAFHGNFTSR